MMKKLFLILYLYIAFNLYTNAQYYDPCWNPCAPSIINTDKDDAFYVSGFGIYGGWVGSGMDYQANNIKISQQFSDDAMRQGFMAGLKFNVDLWTKWVKLSPDFFYIQHGIEKFYLDDAITFIDDKIYLDYVGFALPLGLYVPFDRNGYSGFLLQGKYFASFSSDIQVGQQYSAYSASLLEEHLGRFNHGYGIEAGLILGGITLTVSYDKNTNDIEFNHGTALGNNASYLFRNQGLSAKIGIMATW